MNIEDIGFIPEAVECLIMYVFNELNLDLIWCGHYDFNNNSKRVIEDFDRTLVASAMS